jgi:hypothetical protein
MPIDTRIIDDAYRHYTAAAQHTAAALAANTPRGIRNETIGSLQEMQVAMLDILNWAAEVNKHLAQ